MLKAHEKIEKKQVIFLDKKQCLFKAFQAAEIKKYQLHYHTQFFHNHDDKLIQKSMKVFKEKLCILKKKQDFIIFLNNNFFISLISAVNVNIIFFTLSDNF